MISSDVCEWTDILDDIADEVSSINDNNTTDKEIEKNTEDAVEADDGKWYIEGFMLFQKEKKSLLKGDLKGSNKIAQMWEDLGTSGRQVYVKLAQEIADKDDNIALPKQPMNGNSGTKSSHLHVSATSSNAIQSVFVTGRGLETLNAVESADIDEDAEDGNSSDWEEVGMDQVVSEIVKEKLGHATSENDHNEQVVFEPSADITIRDEKFHQYQYPLKDYNLTTNDSCKSVNLYSGFLFKLDQIQQTWRKQWTSLVIKTKDSLEMFSVEFSESNRVDNIGHRPNEKGSVINLVDASVRTVLVSTMDKRKDLRFRFVIETPTEIVTLCSATSSEQGEWVRLVCFAISTSRTNQTLQNSDTTIKAATFSHNDPIAKLKNLVRSRPLSSTSRPLYEFKDNSIAHIAPPSRAPPPSPPSKEAVAVQQTLDEDQALRRLSDAAEQLRRALMLPNNFDEDQFEDCQE
eukprot:CAMPEP_0204875448 /NCGR_PEP_ID=MMETSP1348-20121228/45949_1 /ASSEMBLY_ACC=CAM_ASM_000700 /TAXON_ID=215587 /ORGANISM="Aplanochytrium stocchinoi, Strain GSBS06" /LENGTH=460 /DNA_ID=CAMNT_0052031893 /DNA_START=130 /DNA_END=1512 /DNA_ORIENTATION=+